VAEQDADRGDSREDDREPEVTPTGDAGNGGGAPVDEDAAWAAIVAGYGEEPPDPPGAKPFKSIEDLVLLEGELNSTEPGKKSSDPEPEPEPGKPLGSSIVFAPGVGPRDHELPEASDDDLDDDEGHFVPPDPPLPTADTTAKFAWLAVIGGPVLLLLAVLLQWEMTWWLTTLGVGGFLGGFATLVARMQHGDDDEDDDPGRGAVV